MKIPRIVFAIVALAVTLHAASAKETDAQRNPPQQAKRQEGKLPDRTAAQKKPERAVLELSGTGWRLWQDINAEWKNDELYAPGQVDIAKLPVRPPTGGWEVLKSSQGKEVSIPNTLEGTLFVHPGTKNSSPGSLYKPFMGVSWWYRNLQVPEIPPGSRVLLRFEAVSQRAEVFLDQKLVGYDLVGYTPFEVDITDAVKSGAQCQLAVRVTNPGGNWGWEDYYHIQWGKHGLPLHHSFGGLPGGVKLVVVAPVYMDDVYVQNTPAMRDVNVQVTVKNTTPQPVSRNLQLLVMEKSHPEIEVFRQEIPGAVFQPGVSSTTFKISVPNAKLWDLENPHLYVCSVRLSDKNPAAGDHVAQPFGFRWFDLDGVGKNAMLRLNGKRIVLRTAISWGYWPGDGMTPTPKLAEKQIRTAKELGLNMLNFHRCMGYQSVLDQADQLGLLYWAEPGGYVSGGTDPIGQAVAREKLLRMVKRDRSHPSMAIYCMINEQWDRYGAKVNDALYAKHVEDMRAVHALDPSRTIQYTSAWSGQPDVASRPKTHMRPMDDTVYLSGWWDNHRTIGPSVWEQIHYRKPNDHYGNSSNTKEIVYWGEEGTVSAPPRLEKIKEELADTKNLGWDGAIYLSWHQRLADFISRKKLTSYFPSIDGLTSSLGDLSLEHQGRKIQLTRICDTNDGYAINGWEDEPFDNYSGVVDCFRNPKGDPSLLSRYNQPLYIAVLPRTQVMQIPAEVVTDFYIVNEKDLKGSKTLKVRALSPGGEAWFAKDYPVSLQGGDTYGQLLVEGVKIPVTKAQGMIRIEAQLVDENGKEQACGSDQIFCVDWKSAKLTGRGAVLETGNRVKEFLKTQKNLEVPAYEKTQGPLDWIVIASPCTPVPVAMNASCFANGGVTTTFFNDAKFEQKVGERKDAAIDFNWPSGSTPDPSVSKIDGYCVRCEAQLLPPKTGQYTLQLTGLNGPATLYIDGKVQPSRRMGSKMVSACNLDFAEGKPVAVKVEYTKGQGDGQLQLFWGTPDGAIDIASLIEKVRRDGTKLLVIDYAEVWAEALAKQKVVGYSGKVTLGHSWEGGNYFVREHPLFKDLPVNSAMNWPYQAVVSIAGGRCAMQLEGEETIVGAYQSKPFQLATAVGIIPCGKGQILLSALKICDGLDKPAGPADMERKLLCNYIEYASPQQK